MVINRPEGLKKAGKVNRQTSSGSGVSISPQCKVFYVRLGEDKSGYHKAIYVQNQDLRILIENVRTKFPCSAGRSLRLVYIDDNSKRITLNESLILQLPDGQDLFVEYLSEPCLAPGAVTSGEEQQQQQQQSIDRYQQQKKGQQKLRHPALLRSLKKEVNSPDESADSKPTPLGGGVATISREAGVRLNRVRHTPLNPYMRHGHLGAISAHEISSHTQHQSLPNGLWGNVDSSPGFDHHYFIGERHLKSNTFDRMAVAYSDIPSLYLTENGSDKTAFDQYIMDSPDSTSTNMYNTAMHPYLRDTTQPQQLTAPQKPEWAYLIQRDSTTSDLSESPRESSNSSTRGSHPNPPKTAYTRTPRKVKSKDERLADNRVAAAKSRANKKERQSALQNIANDLKVENRILCEEVDELREQLDGMKVLLERHESCTV